MWRGYNNQPTVTNSSRGCGYDDGYDERYLETIAEVESIASRPASTATALPALPLYVKLGHMPA